jgi:pimeloyl-ACP methyl ester carboxylesterase
MNDDFSNISKAVTAQTQFAEANGRKIAYRIIGEGETIILNHRFRANLDDWDPAFLDALATNYRVVIFNYTGLATSTGQPHTDLLGFANDVIDLADYLKIDKFNVGGWSLGGFVAQLVATEFADRVSHLILLGTKPAGEVKYPLEKIFIDTAYKPEYTIEDETILFFDPSSALSRRAAIESHNRIAQRQDKDLKVVPELWGAYGAAFEDFERDTYGIREKLLQTDIPVLVVSAQHEICFPPENWFELNRKLPTTQLIVMPQVGHGPQHQYPEIIGNYIHSFIQNF